MKIIAFGTQTVMNKTVRLLSRKDFESISTSDSLDELSTLLQESDFDIAIVHMGLEAAQKAFHLLNAVWGIPVVLIMGTKVSDWQNLRVLDAYAYIPEEAGKAEVIARMKAICRRLSRVYQ